MSAAAAEIVFLGTGDFAVPILHALAQAGATPIAVLSQPDRPAGRGRAVVPTPAHRAALEINVPHFQVPDVNADGLHRAALRRAQLGIVAAFGQKIGPDLLRALPRGFLNLHGDHQWRDENRGHAV
jgi:methionyl-tRNA formyltransferase